MNTWEVEHAHRIGKEVQRLRKVAGLTAQQLGEQTDRLGLKMTRQAISDLENGRRRYVTTAELVILAGALNTSPVNLVYPGPLDREVELMPGVSVLEFVAAEWFSGMRSYLFAIDEVISDRDERWKQWMQWRGNVEATLGHWRELVDLIETRNNMDPPEHIAALNRSIAAVEDRLARVLGRQVDSEALDPPLRLRISDRHDDA